VISIIGIIQLFWLICIKNSKISERLVLVSLLSLGVSLCLDAISIKTLDLDTSKTLSRQSLDKVSTKYQQGLESLDYPEISMFVKILLETIDLNIWKSLFWQVEKILIGFKSWYWQIEKSWSWSRSRLVSTVEAPRLSPFPTIFLTFFVAKCLVNEMKRSGKLEEKKNLNKRLSRV
jgi:hypothetical protein